MPCIVSLDQTNRFVIAQISTMDTYKDRCEARDEALQLCREMHCSRLLVDLRDLKTDRASTIDCFEFGESLSRAKKPFYIAHVMPSDPNFKEDVRFASIVAENRGIIAKECKTLGEAKTWLLG